MCCNYQFIFININILNILFYFKKVQNECPPPGGDVFHQSATVQFQLGDNWICHRTIESCDTAQEQQSLFKVFVDVEKNFSS